MVIRVGEIGVIVGHIIEGPTVRNVPPHLLYESGTGEGKKQADFP